MLSPVKRATGGDVLGVVGKQGAGQVEHLCDPPVGEAVANGALLAARGHKSAPAQAGQMRRDPRLAGADQLHDLADRELLVADELEDVQARGVTQRAEVLGLKLALAGPPGKPKWGCLDHAHPPDPLAAAERPTPEERG